MVAWTLYYDTSRTQNDPEGVLLTVGVASTEHKWLRLEREWRAFLQEFNIPYLHMKELFTGSAFQHLKANNGHLKALECAARIIKARTHKSFGVGMYLDDWRAVDKTYDLSYMRNPYTFVTGMCGERLSKWVRTRHGNPPILHMLEKGDLGQGALVQALESTTQPMVPLEKVDPATGEWLAPFQATDLIAWTVRRMLEDQAAGKRTSPIASMLGQLLPLKAMTYNREELIGICVNSPRHLPLRISRMA